MILLIVGLVLFIVVHSLPMLPEWRERLQAGLGKGGYRALFTLASVVALILIVWGYGSARGTAPVLWISPSWLRHVTVILMLPAMILLVAAYVPGRIKARLHHPMITAVKIWAFAHLLANGTLADLLLFGGILAWAVVDRVSLARRERQFGAQAVSGPAPMQGPPRNDAVAVVIGTVLWALITFWAHQAVIGVPPLA